MLTAPFFKRCKFSERGKLEAKTEDLSSNNLDELGYFTPELTKSDVVLSALIVHRIRMGKLVDEYYAE